MRRLKNRLIWNLAIPNEEQYNITRPPVWPVMEAVMNILWVVQILFLSEPRGPMDWVLKADGGDGWGKWSSYYLVISDSGL